MAKREYEESDFKMEYSEYYVLINGNSIWGTTSGDKCHFHTADEIKMLKEIEKNNRGWKVEKRLYHKPIRI
jgi:hypothetical protein